MNSRDDVIPLVSIIIPTYGRADMLDRAINSVLGQTYKNIEIIVVNDNPKESDGFINTIEVLEAYKNNLKVKFYSDGINRGGSLARNKGIEIAEGEYVTFLDDDDFYYENKIEKQLDHILKNDIDVSVCDMDVMRDNKILKETNKNKAVAEGVENFILNGNVYTPMLFCKKYVLNEIEMFTDTPRFQDHVLILKILRGKYKIKELNEKLFVHVEHENLRITNTKKNHLAYSIRRDYEKELLGDLTNSEMQKYLIDNLYQDYFYIGAIKKSFFCGAVIRLILDFRNIRHFFYLVKILVKGCFS